MGDSHSNRLVGRSPIPISISISEWNRNGSIYIELNPYSSLWIQFFISIPIPVTNQILWRIWPFRFRFQAIPISILILVLVTNQTSPKNRTTLQSDKMARNLFKISKEIDASETLMLSLIRLLMMTGERQGKIIKHFI